MATVDTFQGWARPVDLTTPIIDDIVAEIADHTFGNVHLLTNRKESSTWIFILMPALPNGEPSVRLPTGDVRQLVQKINGYSLEIQKEIKKALGDEAFIRLNGDDKFYLPVNPEIALNILGE